MTRYPNEIVKQKFFDHFKSWETFLFTSKWRIARGEWWKSLTVSREWELSSEMADCDTLGTHFSSSRGPVAPTRLNMYYYIET